MTVENVSTFLLPLPISSNKQLADFILIPTQNCDELLGNRIKRSHLLIWFLSSVDWKFRGKQVGDVLTMTVGENGKGRKTFRETNARVEEERKREGCKGESSALSRDRDGYVTGRPTRILCKAGNQRERLFYPGATSRAADDRARGGIGNYVSDVFVEVRKMLVKSKRWKLENREYKSAVLNAKFQASNQILFATIILKDLIVVFY